MKKILTFVFIVILACLLLDKISGNNMTMEINGNDVDGPLEFLFGMLFAGGGLLIALVAVICAAVMVGLVMAGVGVLMVAIVAGCIALGLLFSAPFMLPLLIPIAIIWVLVSRNRKHSKSN